MDIRQALMDEHSKRQTMAIVEFIGEDSKRFDELMKVFFAGEYRLTQRAAWPMNYCAERHSNLIQPYLPKLLDCLEREDMHDAIRRNVLRLLQYVDIPKRLAGRIYDHSLGFLDDPDQPIAVRVFAMSVAARIANSEPGLMNELRLIIRKHLPHSTAAFRARAKQVL